MRADIDYGFYEARTTFGRIGVKCWVNKGEIMPEGYTGTDLTDITAPRRTAPTATGAAAGTAATAAAAAAATAEPAEAVADGRRRNADAARAAPGRRTRTGGRWTRTRRRRRTRTSSGRRPRRGGR